MVKVDRLPSGNYRARVHLCNGKYKTFTGKDKKDVQLRAAQFEAERTMSVDMGNAAMTLEDAVNGYISQKQNVLSPSTVRGYRAVQRNAVPELMRMKLNEITSETVQRAINDFAKDHSPKYVRNAYGLVSATLAAYAPDLRLKVTLPQKQKTEITIPTEEDMQKIFEYVKGTEMELPIRLGACCGMRRSEILGLKWSDVDLKGNTISISEAVVLDENNKAISKGTKSIAGTRTIRLYPFVKELLEQTPKNGKYVVSLTGNQITKRFIKILKDCDIDHHTFHALRHYFVSVMLSLNVPKSYIANYVGHETEHLIETVYGHVMARKKTNVEDVLQAYFSQSVTPSVTNL